MRKILLFSFIVFAFLNLSCNDPYDFSNPVDSNINLQAPTNLQVVSIGETTVVLSYNDANNLSEYPNAKLDYEIEQSTDASHYTKANNVSISGTQITITGTFYSTSTYTFRMRAKVINKLSKYSNITTVNLTFPAPSNLQINYMTTSQVVLSWVDNSSFETSFEIEQSTDGNNYSVVKTVGANITSASISGTFDSTTTYYFRAQAKTSINKSGYSNIVNRKMPFVSTGMVLVQGGTFTAGSTPVTISSFKIDKYEVTYELWTDVKTWALTHGYTDLVSGQNGYNPVGSNNPVTMVSWYDIVKWCNARSEKEGLSPVYYTDGTQSTIYKTGQININIDAVKWTTNGYRLPTECEWEFAARGGSLTHGYTYSGSNTINDVAWYSSNSGITTHTVGQKFANELGIYDMSGNVWEWCWDWYDSAYPSGGTSDPKGPSTTQSYRLLRGGSFNYNVYFCRVGLRDYYDPNSWLNLVGFRCIQD